MKQARFVSQFDPPAHVVSDHALVRWLERVCGFPMETYREQLAATVAPLASAGVANYRTTDAVYCFRNQVLVTVLEPAMFDRSLVGRERQFGRRPSGVRP